MIDSGPFQGERVGDLILLNRVGQGGVGEVWRAAAPFGNDRAVAVKFARKPRYGDYLRREGKILANLNHPGIVRILGMNAEHSPPYLVRELVEGESLRSLLARGTLPLDRAVEITRQILLALEYAHNAGVVHGDLKPENILIDRLGRVKITDFGLSLVAEKESGSLANSLPSGSTKRSHLVGTLNYMSPEQRIPGKRIDGRTDIYALGLIFFEMLTGDVPQGGEVPSDLRPGLPEEGDSFFRGCYARTGKRFSGAGKARDALERLETLLPAKSPVSMEPIRIRPHLRILSSSASDEVAEIPLSPPASPLREGRMLAEPSKEKHPAPARPAGFWIRAVAIFIDLFFLYLLQYLFLRPGEFVPAKNLDAWPSYPFSHMMGLYLSPCISFREWFQTLGLNLPLFAAYFILSTWLWGRTLGKLIVRIHVVGDDGRKVGFLSSFLRVLGYYLNILTHGIGFLLVLFMPGRRGLHDYLSQSRVVED